MSRAKITATPIQAHLLQPGDLFSTVGPDYWSDALDKGSCGERVYIRTHVNQEWFDDADSTVYRITVEKQHD